MRATSAHRAARLGVALAVAAVAAVVVLAVHRGGGTARSAPPARALGVNLGGATNAAAPTAPATELSGTVASIARAGISWLRVDVPFVTEEPAPGRWDWTVRREISAAAGAHLEVLALLDYPPAWARSTDGQPLPAPFAGFAAAAAAVLGPLGVHSFEIGNEPNLAAYWGAPVSPAAYTAVLRACDAAIHGVDPAATVLTGGLAQTATAAPVAVAPVAFLEGMYAAGAGGGFDALADHPYTYPALPDPRVAGNAFATLGALHQVMAAHGDGSKQVWLTEFGAPTAGAGRVSDATQAAMYRDALADTRPLRWVGPVFAFDWRDTTADGAFGLLRADGSAKPAYQVVVAAAR